MRHYLVFVCLLLFILHFPDMVQAKQMVSNLPIEASGKEPVRVIDGDTFEINNVRIRLWGIDAPELHQNCLLKGQTIKCGQAAKLALMSVLQSGTLFCTAKGHDRYQRSVNQCLVDGKDVAGLLVLSGWALDYPQYSKGYYTFYETEARQDQRGVWRMKFVLPSLWRKGVRHYH